MDMGDEKAFNQAHYYETIETKILSNITEKNKNQATSDLYGNGLLK